MALKGYKFKYSEFKLEAAASCVTIQGGRVIGFYVNKQGSVLHAPIITQTNNGVIVSSVRPIEGTDVLEGVVVTVD